MSAVVPTSGTVRQLDRQAEPDEQVDEEQVKDAPRLARLLMRILRDLALLKRRFWPGHIDHEDRVVDSTGTTKYRFPHGFGGRVRWWVVDWQVGSAFKLSYSPSLSRHTDSDDNTLVLVSYVDGTVTIRVEEAG